MRVIGVGNRWRSDDAAGLLVVDRLRARLDDVVECEGEPVAMIVAWQGAESVVLVDAVSSGAPPGTLHRLDASEEKLPGEWFAASTHHLGVHDAVELARALGKLPRRVIVIGIEGARFGAGERLSPEVEAAVDAAAQLVEEEVAACTSVRS